MSRPQYNTEPQTLTSTKKGLGPRFNNIPTGYKHNNFNKKQSSDNEKGVLKGKRAKEISSEISSLDMSPDPLSCSSPITIANDSAISSKENTRKKANTTTTQMSTKVKTSSKSQSPSRRAHSADRKKSNMWNVVLNNDNLPDGNLTIPAEHKTDKTDMTTHRFPFKHSRGSSPRRSNIVKPAGNRPTRKIDVKKAKSTYLQSQQSSTSNSAPSSNPGMLMKLYY